MKHKLLAPIGFMDSGVGGLTVVKEAIAHLPQENLLYVGDEQHIPYGKKSPNQIVNYASKIGNFFEHKSVKMMVIACNTASAYALSTLKKSLPFPVIGVISAASEEAIKLTNNDKIGVIATEATVNSHAYAKRINELNSKISVVELATQNLVSLVEKKEYKDTKTAKRIIKQALMPLKDTNIDTLILGCTHFPIISDLIHQVMGSDIKLINPAKSTIKMVKNKLQMDNQLVNNNALPKQDRYNFFTTRSDNNFNVIGSETLGYPIKAKFLSL